MTHSSNYAATYAPHFGASTYAPSTHLSPSTICAGQATDGSTYATYAPEHLRTPLSLRRGARHGNRCEQSGGDKE